MAFLKVEQGSCPGQIVELQEERVLLGRHPNCQIVLDNAAVSRHHAQILESHDTFYLEDLRSRNLTYLNGEQVHGRAKLNDNDQIKICDIVLCFTIQTPSVEDSELLSEPEESTSQSDPNASSASSFEFFPEIEYGTELEIKAAPANDSVDGSAVVDSIDLDSIGRLRVETKPEVKLKAILNLSHSLNRMVKQHDVLNAILESLFTIFPPADEGFILLKDATKNKLYVRATKQRHHTDDASVNISMTVIKQAVRNHEAILSADASDDERFKTSESLSGLKIRSVMCVPLIDKANKVLGVIQLNTKKNYSQFTSDDLDILTAVASQASLAIDNSTAHEELLKQQDMQRDLEFATQVQLGFLPSQPPKVAGYEFYDYYEAALRVGGDYFDYVALPNGHLAMALGDVAGKGVPAALLMARLFSSAKYQLLTQPTPSEALAGLNNEIATSGLGHRFITCVFVVLDPVKHQLTIVNAGHMAPLLRHSDQDQAVEIVAQEMSGLPLGISLNEQFAETTVNINPGDTIVVYTDGITETMNANNEIYGRSRLIELMEKGPLPVDDLVNGIVVAVEDFSVDRVHHDDICVVGARRLK